VRFLRAAAQVVAVAGAVALLLYLFNNLTTNLRNQGISTSFDFLRQPLGVDIQLSDTGANAPLWRGLLTGIKNTFALVVIGIPILTIVGVVVGVARLSGNWLVSKLATVYVETLRNIPPLLIIVLVHNAFFLELLPPKNEPIEWANLFIFSTFTLSGPGFVAKSGAGTFWVIMAVTLVVALGLWIWRSRVFDRTGHAHHRVLWSLGTILGVGVIAYFALGQPVGLSRPAFAERIVSGGFSGLSQYFSMLLALALYTASHVAEIVRGSIQAVHKGQTEAANALALTSFQRLRFVILPQAMRIAVPPIINQYLNFTKNTSLAIAIAYLEITAIVFQAIGNGRPAPQLILLLMLSYLAFSLTISLILNILNRRLQLVGR
jgi:general L-amino acid transport system permease protein